MPQSSDEDRLIQSLQDHRDLKYWVMQQLQVRGIACQETYGNDPNGDIILVNTADVLTVQQWVTDLHQTLNERAASLAAEMAVALTAAYVEIKTGYLCGQEARLIATKGTVLAVVSAGKISQPSQQQFATAGIAFAAGVPRSQFS